MDETIKNELKSSMERLKELDGDYKERIKEGKNNLEQLKHLAKKEDIKEEIEQFNKKLIGLKNDYENIQKKKINEMLEKIKQKLSELENEKRIKI